jgi:hypothetical protein
VDALMIFTRASASNKVIVNYHANLSSIAGIYANQPMFRQAKWIKKFPLDNIRIAGYMNISLSGE